MGIEGATAGRSARACRRRRIDRDAVVGADGRWHRRRCSCSNRIAFFARTALAAVAAVAVARAAPALVAFTARRGIPAGDRCIGAADLRRCHRASGDCASAIGGVSTARGAPSLRRSRRPSLRSPRGARSSRPPRAPRSAEARIAAVARSSAFAARSTVARAFTRSPSAPRSRRSPRPRGARSARGTPFVARRCIRCDLLGVELNVGRLGRQLALIAVATLAAAAALAVARRTRFAGFALLADLAVVACLAADFASFAALAFAALAASGAPRRSPSRPPRPSPRPPRRCSPSRAVACFAVAARAAFAARLRRFTGSWRRGAGAGAGAAPNRLLIQPKKPVSAGCGARRARRGAGAAVPARPPAGAPASGLGTAHRRRRVGQHALDHRRPACWCAPASGA